MKKIFFFFIFFLSLENLHANENIVYLDIQYIIDNSDIGLLYKKKNQIPTVNHKVIITKERK